MDGIQAYAQKQYQNDFKALTADQQDQVLRDMEAGTATGFAGITGQQFFQLLVAHVKAGFFADPHLRGEPGADGLEADRLSRRADRLSGLDRALRAAVHRAVHEPRRPSGGDAHGDERHNCRHARHSHDADRDCGGDHRCSDRCRDSPRNDGERSGGDGGRPTAAGTTVNVIEKDFAFAFDTSAVPAGTVTFAITNQGPSPHNLAFTSINKVSETINAGQTTKFTVDFQAGTYPFICNIPGHEQLGMKGTLTVK